MQELDDVKRALRTAMRLVEAVYSEPQLLDTNLYLAASIQQMNFAEDKLIALMLKARRGGTDGNHGGEAISQVRRAGIGGKAKDTARFQPANGRKCEASKKKR